VVVYEGSKKEASMQSQPILAFPILLSVGAQTSSSMQCWKRMFPNLPSYGVHMVRNSGRMRINCCCVRKKVPPSSSMLER
jgi:hypothetical protein